MKLATRVFELCPIYYRNLSELADAMGISVSEVCRVRSGKRNINQKFIVGALMAFPRLSFNDLFYLAHDFTADVISSPVQATLDSLQPVEGYKTAAEDRFVANHADR